VAWQIFGPEAVTKGDQEIFQDIKHHFYSDTGAIELQGLDVFLARTMRVSHGARCSMEQRELARAKTSATAK
jgi:hypothetical protein